MNTSFKRKNKMTAERARVIVEFLTANFSDVIPKTCMRLYEEVTKSAMVPTEKLTTWLNVIANILRNDDGKMVMTDNKAKTIEFIVAG